MARAASLQRPAECFCERFQQYCSLLATLQPVLDDFHESVVGSLKAAKRFSFKAWIDKIIEPRTFEDIDFSIDWTASDFER
ncbi:hypothetical protein AC578_10325 [Pseudocercospora eumusae]|uniref:Uncharacterized protein n=1 Tax=Pseudocercospora eumusae TaxID=321146 RepID=A0A139HRH9_9PEZI|nr:hypothetical protein AC578_10325 [Pseudocercospora eumusae]